ncbi:HesA/MoeB/ThiF family protein [Sedimentibacter saalensis]|uniref:Molybdopterin/thiamine biosynthesis adenylyltransferase n=2 Tax=root TaxID=1 RepID=A0A562JE63_9FIRM|nr:HesA/MoeB/ThiF family protein [Sedimentibacter saalensis]TWH81430.1 molybdopterin/thiamine biosynthesis adenylyltransferase [Sedimentibacter saalensis]
MILKKEQINRYMRHIIMPEIGGKGQKKLLESAVYIYGESVELLSPLIFYLAASGIVRMFCCFENDDGYDELFHRIRDFNDEVIIELIDEQEFINHKHTDKLGNTGFILNIFSGDLCLLKKIINKIDFSPMIISIHEKWKIILQTFTNMDDLKLFAGILSDKSINEETDRTFPKNLNAVAASVSGSLCSIEAVKLCLNIGEAQKKPLYFDIMSMEINSSENKCDYYINKLYDNNHEITSDDAKKLSACKILIVGAGGLGSPAAFSLAMVGVGTIGIIDYDTVEISNLNRQILHSVSRIGMSKVESAKIFLNNVNPHTEIIAYNMPLNSDNVTELIKDYDVVISGVDNISARYLINDACYFAKKPMIEAGVLRFNGINTTIIPDEGHCYRCIYMNAAGSGLSCAETGTLGPVPGIMGFMEAAEAIKLITGKGETLKNKLLMFDALNFELDIFTVNKNPDCSLCGKNPDIKVVEHHEFICENKNDNNK